MFCDSIGDLHEELIESLHVKKRTVTLLKRANIKTIGDLLKYHPMVLWQIKGVGGETYVDVLRGVRRLWYGPDAWNCGCVSCQWRCACADEVEIGKR